MINNHNIFFVDSLNIFTTCRILRLFPAASKCEIMNLINKSLIITLAYDVSFSWRNICSPPPITLWNIDNRCYHGSELVSRVWETYMKTPKTHLYVIWKQSYSTLPYSGGHFGFCPLAANAQGEIQGTLSMLLRWVLIHQNDVFMFIVSQAVM